MAQQDKKGEFSIRTTFKKWLEIQKVQNAVFLFGNTATGKTTIGHLINKVVGEVRDQKLIFKDEGKKGIDYFYQGQINQKTSKPLTVYPKLYKIQRSDTNIIEVPSRIYTLEPKKRPYLDRLLNSVGLTYSAKFAKFVFIVDAKNTSSKFDVWKKVFQSIFDNYTTQFFNKQALQSVGFIMAKGGKDIDIDTFLNRMNSLYDLFKQESRQNQYRDLLNAIKSNKQISIFTKLSSQAQAQNQIKQIVSFVERLKNFQISQLENKDGQTTYLQHEVVELKQENIFLDEFNQLLKEILKFVSSFIKLIFAPKQSKQQKNRVGQKIQDKIEQQIQQKINQNQLKRLASQIQKQNQDTKWGNTILQTFNKLLKKSNQKINSYANFLGKCNLLISYRQQFQNKKNNKCSLRTILNILAESGLILSFSQQLNSIYLCLIQYAVFQERFQLKIRNLDYRKQAQQAFSVCFSGQIQSKLKEQFMEASISSDQTPQNASIIMKILEVFFPDENLAKDSPQFKKKKALKQAMELKRFDEKNPEKNIIQLHKVLRQIISTQKQGSSISAQQKQFSKKLALIVAKALKNTSKHYQSAQIYKKCGKYHLAKKCYQKLFEINHESKLSLQIYQGYLNLLVTMSLQQKALQKCYEIAQIYEQNAKQLIQKIVERIQKEKKIHIIQLLYNPKSQSINYYDEKTLKQVEMLANNNQQGK